MAEPTTLDNALSVMGYLTDKAEEREFLKRIKTPLCCTVLKESEALMYKSGPKIGSLRGHKTNLVTESGDIFSDIMLNDAVDRGEVIDVEIELLIPASFLSGNILVHKKGARGKPNPLDTPVSSAPSAVSGVKP